MKEHDNVTVPSKLEGNFWLVSADMGYGHQRAIYPLKPLAHGGEVLNANTSRLSSPAEKRLWKHMLVTYEFLSRASKLPVVGKLLKRTLDDLLHIPKPYTRKDLTKPTLQVKYLKHSINRGLCRGIIDEIKNPPLPLITSFYTSAIAAEAAGHPRVYCIICDTDINRVWAPEDPRATTIEYFAPNSSAARRLASYGVPRDNIHITGFPLPLELLGNRELHTLRHNLRHRLHRLDPRRRFSDLYETVHETFIGGQVTPSSITPPVTITFCVGGAGAQKEIGRDILKSLRKKILNGKVVLNLVAGTREDTRQYFSRVVADITGNHPGVNIIYAPGTSEYFDAFNQALHTTDVLWTKPSELSFYCSLGIPIIMTPAIGPQEKFNRDWLIEIGAGLKQHDPRHANQWLFNLISKGRLAGCALNGFMKGRKYGTYHILDFLEQGTFERSYDPRKR